MTLTLTSVASVPYLFVAKAASVPWACELPCWLVLCEDVHRRSLQPHPQRWHERSCSHFVAPQTKYKLLLITILEKRLVDYLAVAEHTARQVTYATGLPRMRAVHL